MKQRRFHVFTNLAMSIDGKIASHDRTLCDLGSDRDRYFMDVHRSRASAVLMGADTLRTFKNPVMIKRKRFLMKRKIKRLNKHPVNVVISSNPNFSIDWPFFTNTEIERVLVVPKQVSDNKLKPYRHLAHIFKYSSFKEAPLEIIEYLQSLGCSNLLLEGGGGTIFPFVALDLIDEWNVTITPKIIGGSTAPTMVDGEGFTADAIKDYRLKKLLRHRGELFLTYGRCKPRS